MANKVVAPMRICVLQPSYEHSELVKDYAACDPPRDLSSLAPEWSFRHEFLNKSTVYRQLKRLRRERFDVFVNLCEGHLEWDIPSIDVIHALDLLQVPYTGPSAKLYEPRKESIKEVARRVSVLTPTFVVARGAKDLDLACSNLVFPLFVKPNEGGDSFGIDDSNLCVDEASLRRRVALLWQEFDELMIEEYVSGREVSVLVAANPDDEHAPLAFRPVEFRFPARLSFKTYKLKNSEYYPEANVPLQDPVLDRTLRDAASRIFTGYEGVGYARMDFRLDAADRPYVIDVNFTCSVFYPEGYYGTADYILHHDGFGAANFLRLIVREAIERKHRLSSNLSMLIDLFNR